MRDELRRPFYFNRTILVAWEHTWAPKLARLILSSNGGDPAQVKGWVEGDYDTVLVIRIDHGMLGLGRPKATFAYDKEGLNGQSKTCPGAR